MSETRQLQERIRNLEDELAAALEQQTVIEQNIAAAYAGGDPADKLLGDLATSRDRIAGMVAALRQLDGKLFDVQSSEHLREQAALEAESESQFKAVMREAGKAVGSLRKVLASHLDDEAVEGVLARTLELAGAAVWQAIDEAASAQYAERVPAMPTEPLPRDELGQAIQPGLSGIYI